ESRSLGFLITGSSSGSAAVAGSARLCSPSAIFARVRMRRRSPEQASVHLEARDREVYRVLVAAMEAILNRKPEDLEDFYGLLGCDELSTVRALACHPDKHPENPSAVKDFQKLQKAKDILTDEKKRKNYDLWLRSQIKVPFSEWQALSDSVKTRNTGATGQLKLLRNSSSKIALTNIKG
ncbi:hypothetical protein DNTS_009866, partial [Danionella cerebrum]